jgi:glucosamine-6-phosphate deaminase
MRIRCFRDRRSMSEAAAGHAAASIRHAIDRKGRARIVAATAASQLEFLSALTGHADIPWPRVELFHLDEYVALPATHPASFRRLLLTNVIEKTGITSYHLLDGEADPESVCREVGRALASERVDVAFVGIGENGHLAFNDPPADFNTTDPYIIVTLDEPCRRQQVGEGWFARLEDVPTTALSMSIAQILKSDEILAIVPDERKAAAVRATLEDAIAPAVPASILRTHPNVTLFVDEGAASRLSPSTRAQCENDDRRY